MSGQAREPDLSDLPKPTCEFCGEAIDTDEQRCPARDEGVCRP